MMTRPEETPSVGTLVAADNNMPPEGFVELPQVGNFDKMIGQLYGKPEGAELIMGFRVSERHINAHGTCHGGMIASFADMLGYSGRVAADLCMTSTPTVSLAVEYLRPVLLGDWVEGRCELVKQGRRLLFTRITGLVKGVPVFTATSINIPGGQDALGGAALEQMMQAGKPPSANG